MIRGTTMWDRAETYLRATPVDDDSHVLVGELLDKIKQLEVALPIPPRAPVPLSESVDALLTHMTVESRRIAECLGDRDKILGWIDEMIRERQVNGDPHRELKGIYEVRNMINNLHS